jgi:hypothetical protein
MESFKAFFEQQEFVEQVLNEFNGVPSASAQPMQGHQPMQGNAAVQPVQHVKPWSAKKDEILQMWRNMRADTPIIMTPIADKIPGEKEHSTYGEDGIRITGSWNFISAVLARLKEIVGYENPQHKLRLIFRGIDPAKSGRADRQSYVFYANLEGRSHGKAGRPKGSGQTPAPQI